jgi:hypothetical protein
MNENEPKYLPDVFKDNEVINFLTDVFQNGYDQYYNFADLLDEVGILSGPVKFVIKIIDYGKQKKFKVFIKNLYTEYSYGNCEDKDMEKLNEYLKRPKNLNFIVETIDSAVNSKSINCSSLLAIFAGKILKQRDNIEYKDFVIINALRIMLDDDLQNFKKLYELLHNGEVEGFRTSDMKEELESNNFKIFELEQTIEKLKSVQVLGYDIGGAGNVGNAWGAFVFNDNSHLLYSIVNMNILNELN